MNEAPIIKPFCKICNTRLPRDDFELCDVCLGFEQTSEPPKPEPPPLYTCQTCGEKFESYKVGNRFAKKICWPCLKKKKESGKIRRPKKAEPMLEYREPENVVEHFEPEDLAANPLIVTLDFSAYPWALEWLNDSDNHYQSPTELMVREIAEKVPADWLKNYLLNNGARV